MAYDLPKTQFLISEYCTRAFKRKRTQMLFKNGEPMRPITNSDWLKLRSNYPAEVKQDGLTVKSVWTLVEIKK